MYKILLILCLILLWFLYLEKKTNLECFSNIDLDIKKNIDDYEKMLNDTHNLNAISQRCTDKVSAIQNKQNTISLISTGLLNFYKKNVSNNLIGTPNRDLMNSFISENQNSVNNSFNTRLDLNEFGDNISKSIVEKGIQDELINYNVNTTDNDYQWQCIQDNDKKYIARLNKSGVECVGDNNKCKETNCSLGFVDTKPNDNEITQCDKECEGLANKFYRNNYNFNGCPINWNMNNGICEAQDSSNLGTLCNGEYKGCQVDFTDKNNEDKMNWSINNSVKFPQKLNTMLLEKEHINYEKLINENVSQKIGNNLPSRLTKYYTYNNGVSLVITNPSNNQAIIDSYNISSINFNDLSRLNSLGLESTSTSTLIYTFSGFIRAPSSNFTIKVNGDTNDKINMIINTNTPNDRSFNANNGELTANFNVECDILIKYAINLERSKDLGAPFKLEWSSGGEDFRVLSKDYYFIDNKNL
jgi:hypothetical protein